MRFHVELTPFIKMVQIVTETTEPLEDEVRVVASQGQICLKGKEITAEMDAAVSKGGQCTVSCAQVLKALKTQHGAHSLIVEAGKNGLHIGRSSLAVKNYSPEAVVPGAFQVFFASSWGLVHPETSISCNMKTRRLRNLKLPSLYRAQVYLESRGGYAGKGPFNRNG